MGSSRMPCSCATCKVHSMQSTLEVVNYVSYLAHNSDEACALECHGHALLGCRGCSMRSKLTVLLVSKMYRQQSAREESGGCVKHGCMQCGETQLHSSHTNLFCHHGSCSLPTYQLHKPGRHAHRLRPQATDPSTNHHTCFPHLFARLHIAWQYRSKPVP